jgi:hypothetical protein
MRQVQAAQRFERWFERAAVADTFQVSANVQGVSVSWRRAPGGNIEIRPLMKLLIAFLCAVFALPGLQQVPLASFTGTVRHLSSGRLTLARPGEEDLDITCTHKTRYFKGSQQVKRSAIQPGDRVTVEAALDPLGRPEAVNVRLMPSQKP